MTGYVGGRKQYPNKRNRRRGNRTRGKTPQATKSYVRKALNVFAEHKKTTITAFAAQGLVAQSDAGQCQPLQLIAVGTAQADNRIGSVITPKRLSIRLLFDSFNESTTTTCRYVIVADKQQLGAVPTIASLLRSQAAGLGGPSPLSDYSYTQLASKRYTIIFDGIVVLDPGVGVRMVRHHEFTGKKLPSKISFIGAAANQASLGTNALHIFWCSDQPTASAPVIGFDSSLEFEDA